MTEMMLWVGDWGWAANLLAIVLVAGPGMALATQAGARRRARLALRAWGTPLSPEGFADRAPAVLEGCLQTRPGATVPRPGDGLPAAIATVAVDDAGESFVSTHAQAPGLTVVSGGVVVEVPGKLDLRVGSRELHLGLSPRWVRGRLRAQLTPSARAAAGSIVVRSIAPSERVRVAGFLRCVSAAEDVGLYRQAAARWQLVPAQEGGTLPVVAAGRVRTRGPSLLVSLRRVSLALVVFAAASLGGGELAFSRGSFELAALTPLRRDAALARLFDRARRTARQTRQYADLEALARLPSLRPRCHEAVDLLARQDEPEHAAQLGEQCGTAASLLSAAGQWAILGRHDRASRAYARTQGGGVAAVRSHIAAGAFAEASRSLQLLEQRPDRLCLAAALLAREPGRAEEGRIALQRIAQTADIQTRIVCGTLLADLTPGPDRLSILAAVPRTVTGTPWDELRRLLTWEVDPGGPHLADEPPLPIDAMPSSLAYPYGPSLHVAPGLEAAVLERIQPSTVVAALALRARLATARTTLEAIAGESTAAVGALADARRAFERIPSYTISEGERAQSSRALAGMESTLLLRAGDPTQAVELAGAQVPWQREALQFAARELEGARVRRGAPPRPDQTLERIFVRQGARALEARVAADRTSERLLSGALVRLRAALLRRDTSAVLAALDLPLPQLAVGAPPWGGALGEAELDMASPVVRRMLQIYEIYGTPQMPIFPIGTLRAGEAVTFPFQVAAGECRVFVAVGGPGVRDIDLRIVDPQGATATDATRADLAVVRACSSIKGSTAATVQVSAGAGAVAVQSFVTSSQ